jgi:bis(5'-nucleosyl)-tetraphosphatase (symmetrical)
MATYAIGDVQGCYTALQRLLDALRFDDREDVLWLVGDLVNRGPDSLATLRFVRGLGQQAITILGNHDLHLLAIAAGLQRQRKDDTLVDVLAAPDRDELLEWLRARPLMHVAGSFAMVHAGLLPQWTITQARKLAGEVERELTGENWRELLAAMYGNQPVRWSDTLTGYDRLRVIINAMTRMRLCSAGGDMEFTHKGQPTKLPDGYMPWFDAPGARWRGLPVIFGHWSALGLKLRDDLIGLDTGCLWGRRLTAIRLEDRRVFQVSCREPAEPARAQ